MSYLCKLHKNRPHLSPTYTRDPRHRPLSEPRIQAFPLHSRHLSPRRNTSNSRERIFSKGQFFESIPQLPQIQMFAAAKLDP
jgi:hypothetical protein